MGYMHKSLLTFILLVLPTAGVIHAEESTRYYDATHYKSDHKELGLHEQVKPMLMIYETDIFQDQKHLSHHINDQDLPDGSKFLDKLKAFPNLDVMVDIESLNGQVSDEERLDRIAYLTKVMDSIRSQSKVLGIDDRKWFWYGAPYTPRANLDRLKQAKRLLNQNRESLKPLLSLFDYYAVPCYDRWDGPEQLDRYEKRLKHLKEFCILIDKPAYAILSPTFAPSHSISKLRKQPIDKELASKHFEIANEIFDGVIQWQAPEKYVPEEIRKEATQARVYLFELMNNSAIK